MHLELTQIRMWIKIVRMILQNPHTSEAELVNKIDLYLREYNNTGRFKAL